MQRKTLVFIMIAGMALFSANRVRADVPAPPVNQLIGMDDVSLGDLAEADCRVCHDSGVADRHHNLYEQPIPPGSNVPNPDTDGDGVADTNYACLSCHQDFVVVRDCTECHKGSSPHHTTPDAVGRNCVACHGDVVDNFDDGHYIPSYSPSLVTPFRSDGNGLPANSRGNLAGACNYCHDNDNLTPSVILSNNDLHHNTGLANCGWCHDFSAPFEEQIRACETCHGPDSLHNIQADSPNPNNIGTLVVGEEDAGFGHVGRDAGAGDSDCWGCHGFAFAAAPKSGPVIPSIDGSDVAVIKAGTDTTVIVTGSGFTNTAGELLFKSSVKLTAPDGTSVTLTPNIILPNVMTVTIPGTTVPGNYDLQAIKAQFTSNPAVISIVPDVVITNATADGGTVTINGHGFGGYSAAGSGTTVTTAANVKGTVVSWSDTTIVAEFASGPNEVTVNSVFGTDTSEVGGGGGDSWTLRIPFADAAEMQVTFSPLGQYLLVNERINGQSIMGIGVEYGNGAIFWFDVRGAMFYGVADPDTGSMRGFVFNFQGTSGFWLAKQ